MPTMKIGAGLAKKLEAGASILAAAETVDTQAIAEHVASFSRVQAQFRAAEQRIDLSARQLANTRRTLRELDAEQAAAVNAFAGALAFDGYPRLNPFAPFGAPPPSALVRLPYAKEAATIHRLVAAVLQAKPARRATIRAAQRADAAATAVERRLEIVAKQENVLHALRHQRNALVRKWTATVAALKLRARATAVAGDAPAVHVVLFERPKRTVPARAKRPRVAAPKTSPSAASPKNS